MLPIILSSIIIILLVACAALGMRLSRAHTQSAVDAERIKSLQLQIEETKKENDKRKQEEREMEQRFELLANRALTQNAGFLRKQSDERLQELLSPLRDNISAFSKSVTEAYNNEARERFSLQERIKELVSLNQSLSAQARELTDALRGNSKVQGDWGEMILTTLLEKSGLQKGVHFTVQQTRNDEGQTLVSESGNRLRPDVIINYPDGRCMVVDSKVSLTSYINMINADDPDEVKRLGLLHVTSVKNHIKELTLKRYQDYIGDSVADFVMMFIQELIFQH